MATLLLSCDEYIYEHNGRYYAPNLSYLEFYQRYLRVFEMLRLITRCKHVTTVKSGYVPLDTDSRIEYIPLPFYQGPRQYATVYFSIGNILKKSFQNCDAAILRIPSTEALRIGKMVKNAGIPYACEVVYDAEDAWRSSRGLNKLLWKKIDKEMRLLCATANGVSCVTEHYLQQHYYPTNKESFNEHYSSISLDPSFYGKPRLYPDKKTFVIAHVANQVEWEGRKGHKEILSALKILKDQGLEVLVQFAGKSYNDGIDKLSKYATSLGICNNIVFSGFLSRAQLSCMLDNADLFVLPTRAEGLPRVLIEAMAKGLPCLTTNVSGNSELIDKDCMFDFDNANDLANKIRQIILHKDFYETESARNYYTSLKYESSVLQTRRDAFYNKLKECIRA